MLEPPRLLLGQPAVADLVVETPPGWSVELPRLDELPGLWVIGVESLPVERGGERWRHRTRIRLRARELGALELPELALALRDPDGEAHALSLAPRRLEVASVLPEFPGRDAPFGLEAPPAEAAGGPGWWAPAAAALAGVGAAALLARRTRRRAAPVPPALPPPVWDEALAALAAAGREAERDPRAAADRAASALRRYIARRFGADAEVRTAEELAAQLPPWSARSHWPGFAALVRWLDEARFRPETLGEEALLAALGDAARLVRETAPPEAR